MDCGKKISQIIKQQEMKSDLTKLRKGIEDDK